MLCPQGYLLYRDTGNHTMSAIKINPETLEPDGTVIMPGTEQAAKAHCIRMIIYQNDLVFIYTLHCRSTFRRAEHHLHRWRVHKPDRSLQRCEFSTPAEDCCCHDNNMRHLLSALQKMTRLN